MRYAVFGAHGAAELREDSAPPAGAITLTDEQVSRLLSGEWKIEAGGSLVPAPAAVVTDAVPQVVSKFQAKAALLGAGLLAQVEQMMEDVDTSMFTKLAWSEAQEFRRSSPTVAAMAAALGLDDAALDDLFTTAASIEA